jgi:hypothetical protein
MAWGIFSASVEPRFFIFLDFWASKKVCFEGERWLPAFFSHHLALLAAALPSVKVWQSPAIFSSPNGKLKMNTFFLDKSLMRWRAGPACSQHGPARRRQSDAAEVTECGGGACSMTQR